MMTSKILASGSEGLTESVWRNKIKRGSHVKLNLQFSTTFVDPPSIPPQQIPSLKDSFSCLAQVEVTVAVMDYQPNH